MRLPPLKTSQRQQRRATRSRAPSSARSPTAPGIDDPHAARNRAYTPWARRRSAPPRRRSPPVDADESRACDDPISADRLSGAPLRSVAVRIVQRTLRRSDTARPGAGVAGVREPRINERSESSSVRPKRHQDGRAALERTAVAGDQSLSVAVDRDPRGPARGHAERGRWRRGIDDAGAELPAQPRDAADRVVAPGRERDREAT
jgi:hypothetical protein